MTSSCKMKTSRGYDCGAKNLLRMAAKNDGMSTFSNMPLPGTNPTCSVGEAAITNSPKMVADGYNI